jgi:hypothetical protein
VRVDGIEVQRFAEIVAAVRRASAGARYALVVAIAIAIAIAIDINTRTRAYWLGPDVDPGAVIARARDNIITGRWE